MQCFFCEKNDFASNLRLASTLELDKKVRECAILLNDGKLVAKLSTGDLIAIEAKYHAACLVKLYNRARPLQKQCCDATDSSSVDLEELAAFAELIGYIEECLERDHHEQKPGVQSTFLKDVVNTVSCFEELGNPFTEESENLMAIHTKDIMDDSVVATAKNARKIGEEQFCLFAKERFIDRSKPVTDPLKKNNLPTFSTPTKKAVSKDQANVKLLKEDCSLFGRLYIACQTSDGNLDEFFSYENQPWPPSL